MIDFQKLLNLKDNEKTDEYPAQLDRPFRGGRSFRHVLFLYHATGVRRSRREETFLHRYSGLSCRHWFVEIGDFKANNDDDVTVTVTRKFWSYPKPPEHYHFRWVDEKSKTNYDAYADFENVHYLVRLPKPNGPGIYRGSVVATQKGKRPDVIAYIQYGIRKYD